MVLKIGEDRKKLREPEMLVEIEKGNGLRPLEMRWLS